MKSPTAGFARQILLYGSLIIISEYNKKTSNDNILYFKDNYPYKRYMKII